MRLLSLSLDFLFPLTKLFLVQRCYRNACGGQAASEDKTNVMYVNDAYVFVYAQQNKSNHVFFTWNGAIETRKISCIIYLADWNNL